MVCFRLTFNCATDLWRGPTALNLSHSLFGFSFGFQSAIIDSLPDLLLESALSLVKAALDLVFVWLS